MRSWISSCFSLAFLSFSVAMGGCADDDERFSIQPDPKIGATAFISASSTLGQRYVGPRADAGGADESTNGGGGEVPRTIEEGDIYRVLDGGLVLNLNAYRGLQVIDVSDPSAPEVIGALRISGTPVECYVRNDQAIVLMNDWYGYAGGIDSAVVSREQGGVVLMVDLSDPTQPALLDRQVLAGSIMTSRLARGSSDILYLAASLWRLYDGNAVASGDRTIVQSLALSGDSINLVSELDLGGYVADIQATPSALLVARNTWSPETGDYASLVGLVDITSPDGVMTLGTDIAVAGRVKSQFNMDLRENILRVVSEGDWTDRQNHLETFDVSDITDPIAVDSDTFGEGESLFATLFVDNDKGFFVTYFRQDPFHAFEIGPDGIAVEKNAFIVSGWNDFFRSIFGDTRLLGVGIDDAFGTRKLSLSLYDTTDLENPEPLIARSAASLDSAWSEANWDHRAFSVLEGAVAVEAESDSTVLETGLVLLPYSGWSEDGYQSGVQLFTFSETTLTARGLMPQDVPVRRSFLTDDDIAASLSDVNLSLHDISDPDAPALLGTVDIAPNYPEIDIYGNGTTRYGLRHRESAGWNWWGKNTPPAGLAEVVSLESDPDIAPALATFEVPPGASITKVGDLAVVMSSSWILNDSDPKGGAWQTTIAVWDLGDPMTPIKRGDLVTRELPPYWSGWYYGMMRPEADCLGCGGGYGISPRGTVVGQSIAFLEGIYESAPAGFQRYCVTTPPSFGDGTVEPDPKPDGASTPADPRSAASAGEDGVYYTGRIECMSQDEGPETCYGAIYACTGFEVDCVPVEKPLDIGAQRECREDATYRYWTRWVVHVLDLSNPEEPAVADPIKLPEVEEGVGVIGAGSTLWVSTREPVSLADDGRAYVRYWARAVDLEAPSEPEIGPKLNVPGQLLAVDGDTLYLHDFAYDSDHIESAISKAVVEGDVARLVARHRVDNRQVESVMLDGAGHVLLSHGPVYWWYGYDVAESGTDEAWESRLTVLDTEDLTELSTTTIANWSMLRWGGAGRAIFQVPGGLLVMNLDDPTTPYPQVFFSVSAWPEEVIVDGRRIYLAGGLFGLYVLDLDAFDMLPPEP
jgi:hypothetical protein